MKTKIFAVISALVACFSAAQALSYSMVGSSVAFTSGLIGTNGLYVQTPSHFLIGAGSKTATITYRVTATAGHYLSGVTLDPNGAVNNNGTVSISAVHPTSTTALFNFTSPTLATLGESTTALAGTNSQYDVTMTVDLTSQAAAGLAKVSVMQVFYNEQPVPEPAAYLGLALGAAMILVRRKKS
jgi:hypothetical protein